ncbi:MAG: hypothetical protein IJ087_06755 [Eggerthellaceae bacterium]|nr:hypothetical protein [Eggerthellaceae bacterium]
MLVDECDKLYGYHPLDDATACVVRVKRRVPMNILFGPPADRDENEKMMSLFFSKEGKHIICGGTTATIAAKYPRKPPNVMSSQVMVSGIPPMSELEGVDLVTEGVVTMSKVLEYARNYLQDNESYEEWNYGHDGDSSVCIAKRMVSPSWQAVGEGDNTEPVLSPSWQAVRKGDGCVFARCARTYQSMVYL